MADLVLDRSRSRVRIHTFAEGLFARLAHDLELTCEDLSGSCSRPTPETARATIQVPIAGIHVIGVLRSGAVDRDVLSAADLRDIADKMRREVFQAGVSAVIRVDVSYEAEDAHCRLTLPNGRVVARATRPQITVDDGATRVRGKLEVSLSSIGSAPVKGPMGAFRVRDDVAVSSDLWFVP